MGSPTNIANLTLQALALSEAELLARIRELEIDNESLQATLRECLALLARTHVQLDRSKEVNRRLTQSLRDALGQQAA
jgi:hypothetical protein